MISFLSWKISQYMKNMFTDIKSSGNIKNTKHDIRSSLRKVNIWLPYSKFTHEFQHNS